MTRLAGGVALLAVAALLALLGAGALSVPGALAHSDVALATGKPAASEPLRVRLAERALGARSDADFVTAVRAYRRAVPLIATPAAVDSAIRLRQQMLVLLERLAPQLEDPAERSQAEVMLGILVALAAGNGAGTFGNGQGIGGNLLLTQAAQDFRAAVRSDERNEDAKYDLELVLANDARTHKGNGQHGQTKPGKQQRKPPLKAKDNPNLPKGANRYGSGSGY